MCVAFSSHAHPPLCVSNPDSWRTPRSMITSGGSGTMGYGLPAAIGAQLAAPSKIVVDIDGDASFLMSCTELATAAQYNIPVKVR